MKRRRLAGQRGITLIEILVSIGILALIATLTFGAFDGMTKSRTGIARMDERYHQGRQAIARMSREIQAAFLSLHTPQQATLSVRTTAFIGTDSGSADRLDFTSFSHRRLLRNVHESDQNELSYFLGRDPDHQDKMDLLHREQREIDLDPQHGGVVNVLAEDVLSLDFQYLDPLTATWGDAWDSTQAAGQFNRLPMQVRIRMVMRGGVADQPIRFNAKVALGIQTPLNFAIPRSH